MTQLTININRFELNGTFWLILQITQDKQEMCGSAQTAHRLWVSIQMAWEMVSAWLQRMRIKRSDAGATHGEITMTTTSTYCLHREKPTVSVSMGGVPWELDGESVHIMDIKRKESLSQQLWFASTTKWCRTSLQDGFEPDPLESFVIENNCQGRIYIMLRALSYSKTSDRTCDCHLYKGQHTYTGHFTEWEDGSILSMQCN